MGKKPNPKPQVVLFNVEYTDGAQSSNRRVPSHLLDLLDADEQVRAFIEAQDREIAERSGRPRAEIKRIEKVR